MEIENIKEKFDTLKNRPPVKREPGKRMEGKVCWYKMKVLFYILCTTVCYPEENSEEKI